MRSLPGLPRDSRESFAILRGISIDCIVKLSSSNCYNVGGGKSELVLEASSMSNGKDSLGGLVSRSSSSSSSSSYKLLSSLCSGDELRLFPGDDEEDE